MNLREGRTGNRECVFMITTALCMNGLFAFDPFDAYSRGNSTYLSLPIACIAAFLVFALCVFAMNRSRSSDLCSLITYSVGKPIGSVICVYISLLLLVCISRLLDKFINTMCGYFFQDSSYHSVGIYFFIAMLVLAWTGFETINRTAKVMGIIFIAAQILLFANSISSYEAYKIFPIAGDGTRSMLGFSYRSGVLFLPAFATALITTKGMHGTKNTIKNGARAMIIAVIICAASQILLGLSQTYLDLSKVYMPLYRMSMITGKENFIVRLDKIIIFIWLAAALLVGSYFLYSSSLLYCRAFKQKDIRPCSAIFCVMVLMLSLLSRSGLFMSFSWTRILNDYGTLLLGLPLIIIPILAILKSFIKPNAIKGRT